MWPKGTRLGVPYVLYLQEHWILSIYASRELKKIFHSPWSWDHRCWFQIPWHDLHLSLETWGRDRLDSIAPKAAINGTNFSTTWIFPKGMKEGPLCTHNLKSAVLDAIHPKITCTQPLVPEEGYCPILNLQNCYSYAIDQALSYIHTEEPGEDFHILWNKDQVNWCHNPWCHQCLPLGMWQSSFPHHA